MDWSKAKSMVAGPNGLDVTFEDDNGQLGATRVPYSGQQSPVRQPTAWGKNSYSLQFIETSKHLTKPGGGPPKVGSMFFSATEAEALNWAQSTTTSPGYCVILSVLSGNRWFLAWSSCPGYQLDQPGVPTADVRWG